MDGRCQLSPPRSFSKGITMTECIYWGSNAGGPENCFKNSFHSFHGNLYFFLDFFCFTLCDVTLRYHQLLWLGFTGNRKKTLEGNLFGVSF